MRGTIAWYSSLGGWRNPDGSLLQSGQVDVHASRWYRMLTPEELEYLNNAGTGLSYEFVRAESEHLENPQDNLSLE